MTSMLIVDDSKQILTFLKQIFEDKGFEVFTTSSGIEAIHSVKTHCPDHIYSDINMPKMDGFKLAELIYQKFNQEVTLMTATNLELLDEKDFTKIGVYKIIHKSTFVDDVAYILNKQLKATEH